MTHLQKLTILAEQEETLPVLPLIICGKVQQKITNKQVRVILDACLLLDISPYSVMSSVNDILKKSDLDFFMSSYVMQTSELQKRQMIAWAIRFIRVCEPQCDDFQSIKNSLSILFKMIDLLLESSGKAEILKYVLLKKYSDYDFNSLQENINVILDNLNSGENSNNNSVEDSTSGSYPGSGFSDVPERMEINLDKKMNSKWLKNFLNGTQIKLSLNYLDKKPEKFLKLLSGSLSLNTKEKMRVIDAYNTLSKFQLDELRKVFKDEKIKFKFKTLNKEHPRDIDSLEVKCAIEWLSIYKGWNRKIIAQAEMPEGLVKLAEVFHHPENITEIHTCNNCGHEEWANNIRVNNNNNECPMCAEHAFINVDAA